MKKQILSIALIALMLAAVLPTLAAPADGELEPSDSIQINNSPDHTWATVALGTSPDVWPYSDREYGEGTLPYDFIPEKGATYILKFSVYSYGTQGFRVRWTKDVGWDFTEADAKVVNDHVYTANETATFVPAYFQNSIEDGETKIFTAEFIMDDSQGPEGLIGNIGIYGQGGSNEYFINWVEVWDTDGSLLAFKKAEETNWTAIQANGDKDNVSMEFLGEKEFDGLKINNIRFYYANGESKLSMTFVNETDTRRDGFNATIQFLDITGSVIKQVKDVYVPTVQGNSGNMFTYSEAGDHVNVYSFRFIKPAAPYKIEYYEDSMSSTPKVLTHASAKKIDVGERLTPTHVRNIFGNNWLNIYKPDDYGVALVSYPTITGDKDKDVVKVLYMPIPQ